MITYIIIFLIILALWTILIYLFIELKNSKITIKRLEDKQVENEKEMITAIKNNQALSITVFAEEYFNKGMFGTKYKITYYFWLHINGIPFGTKTFIKGDVFKHKDDEQIDRINKYMDEFAEPLISSGIDVLITYFKKRFLK